MPRRFSLRRLLAFTFFFALGCAAFAAGTEAWVVVATTVTVLALVVATIAADDPFYRGFCIMGWAYFLLTTGTLAVTTDLRLAPTRAVLAALDAFERRSQREPPELQSPSLTDELNEMHRGATLTGRELEEAQYLNRYRILQFMTLFVLSGVAGAVTRAWTERSQRKLAPTNERENPPRPLTGG